jgi:hypothetical protein
VLAAFTQVVREEFQTGLRVGFTRLCNVDVGPSSRVAEILADGPVSVSSLH